MLEILAPLSSTYVERGAARTPAEASRVVAEAEAGAGFYAPCSIEATVTIDPKGRVCWPRAASCEVLVLSLGDGSTIEVQTGSVNVGGSHRLDGRGRLQLPPGLMRAAGMGPGDRVVIVRWAEPEGFAVVASDALAVRRAAA